MFTPKASITSADPHFEVRLRLPCLATRTPAPAVTNAEALEILKVPLASPPVPQVSTSASRPVPLRSSAPAVLSPQGGSGVAAVRIASAKPTISSTVSPFIRKATNSAAICESVQLPSSTSAITWRDSASDNESPWFEMRCRASSIMCGNCSR